MKILLVAKHSIVEPLGILFLASVLKKQGHRVDVFLMNGADICDKEYDFVGFSTYTGFHRQVFNLCKLLSQSKVIIGGPHATFFSDDCLAYASRVVVGEGLRSILSAINSGPGVFFDSQLVSPEEIPIPDREPLYSSYPSFPSNPIKNVMASFGCPYTCSYCYNDSYKKLYSDFRVRYRTVKSVIEECQQLKKYSLKLIFFEDDCFGADLNWLREFSYDYERLVGVPFHCQIRPEMSSNERLRLLKSAGCQGVTLAIETYREDVRKDILNRNYSNKDIYSACAEIKKLGMKLRTEQMLGIPNTTLEDELNLLRMNIEIEPDIAWTSTYTPYLGTTLGDWCKENKWYNGSNDDLENSFFSDSKINFMNGRAKKTNVLQKIFSTCAKIPQGNILAKKFLDSERYNFDSWFSNMRTHLYDYCLYSASS